MLEINIPKKGRSSANDNEFFNHQTRVGTIKAIKFARVREVLGGYSSAELLEILIDKAIEAYYDGKKVNEKYLPKAILEMDDPIVSQLISKKKE